MRIHDFNLYIGKTSEKPPQRQYGDIFIDEEGNKIFIYGKDKRPTEYGGNGTIPINNSPLGSLSRSKGGQLKNDNETGFKIIGGFYYPRKSMNPDWVSEMVRTDISEEDRLKWSDIEDDLDQLVSEGVNTVRVVIQYNLTTFDTNPLVDDSFNVDVSKEAVILSFLNRCRQKGLYVFTQTNFGYEGELSEVDINEMSLYNNSTGVGQEALRFNAHIDWMTSIINNYSDVVICHKIFNEPDGFGTWANYNDAVTILRFLGKIKERFISGAPNVPYIVNAVTHVNFNNRFNGAVEGEQSLYEISDWAVFNSYYWADNGFFNYTHYRRQFEFMVNNNYLNKPLLMTEFGWPSDYEGQDYTDEENQDESFVPANGQFDRPIGNNTLMPHTQESQDKAVKEAVFFSEENDAIGVMCWSLYKHVDRLGLGKPSFFQDSFGLIGADGSTENKSFKYLVNAFGNKFNSDEEAPFSITGGSVFGGAHINGDQGFEPNDVPAGVFIPVGGGFVSNPLNLKSPFKLNAVVRQTSLPSDNGIVIGVEFENFETLQFRFEDFSNRWRLFRVNSQGDNELAATPEQTGAEEFDFGTEDRLITIDFSSQYLNLYVDGVKQNFFEEGEVEGYNYSVLDQTALLSNYKLICNATTSDVELKEVYYSK